MERMKVCVCVFKGQHWLQQHAGTEKKEKASEIAALFRLKKHTVVLILSPFFKKYFYATGQSVERSGGRAKQLASRTIPATTHLSFGLFPF